MCDMLIHTLCAGQCLSITVTVIGVVCLHDGMYRSMSTSTINPGASDALKDVSLLEYLDLSQLNCLNESSDHPFKMIVSNKSRNTSKDYLLSDADEQLLLNIPAVRVRSLVIHGSSESQAPHMVKLVVNRPSLGFEDVENAEEPEIAQLLDISQDDVKKGNLLTLRYVRFQTVNSLHIFVSSNHGDEQTRIDSIDIFGVPVETTKKISNLMKQDD